MKNQNVQQVMKVVTIAGSAVLVLNSAMGLFKAGTSMNLRGAIMPSVSILVGLAAFNYAMKSTPTIKN
jgi:Mg2+ and Co2+ transporter CorA